MSASAHFIQEGFLQDPLRFDLEIEEALDREYRNCLPRTTRLESIPQDLPRYRQDPLRFDLEIEEALDREYRNCLPRTINPPRICPDIDRTRCGSIWKSKRHLIGSRNC